MENQQKYLVAIKCITYNHEKYLADALEGFVMQKTNFPFVAIVHDDASTDGTAEVLRQYAEKYPDIIHPIYETENQYSKHDGSIGRIMDEAIAATGAKYIAMCEGDDYWTDPYKLQKQVDFLESHPDYSMCVTNCKTRLGDKYGVGNHYIWDTYTTEQVLLHNSGVAPKHGDDEVGPAGHTSTFLYRNPNIPAPEWFKKCFIGDEPILVWMSTYGKIKFINEKTSVYRKNVGVSSRNFSFEKDWLNRIAMYRAMNDGLEYRYNRLICSQILAHFHKRLTKLYFYNHQYIRCASHFMQFVYNKMQ